MSGFETRRIDVEIYGRRYAIRSESSEDQLHELAKRVHDKMVDLEASTGTVDTIRLAVLTALNFADDAMRLESLLKEQERDLNRECNRVERLISAALEEHRQTSPA